MILIHIKISAFDSYNKREKRPNFNYWLQLHGKPSKAVHLSMTVGSTAHQNPRIRTNRIPQ